MVLESGRRGRIVTALKQRGWLVDSNPAGPGTGRGRSDLTVCADGLFIALEVKAPGGHPTLSQERYLRQVRAAGGVGAVVESPEQAVDIVERALEARALNSLDAVTALQEALRGHDR